MANLTHWPFTVNPIAAIIAPFALGLVADRFFATEKVLAVLHLLGGVVLLFAPQLAGNPTAFILALLAYNLCYMPTLGLANSLAFHHITDQEKQFPKIRVFGTLGWIVAGLFIYASLILAFGVQKSGFAAALAISVMMLPIMIRSADVVLRLVPGNLKEASYALGAGQWSTIWRVTLPTAKSGLMTSIILGTALGIGETAPVLLTAGFTASLNTNPIEGPMIALPLATWEFVKSPEPAMIARGFGTAAALMILVLILFIVARIIGGRGAGNLSPIQARRAKNQSRRDLARMESNRIEDKTVFANLTGIT
jgi:phosphate transport system permease protein